MTFRKAAFLYFCLAGAVWAQNQEVVISVDGSTPAANGAVLRALDRINGQVTDLEISPGQTLRYERLDVTLTECRYPAGDEKADAFAYLTISDVRAEEVAFEGWMFGSSPALSSLDHPRYDIWVLNCRA